MRNPWFAIVMAMANASTAWGDAPATMPAPATLAAPATQFAPTTQSAAPATQSAPATQAAVDPPDAPTYITLHVKDAKGSDVLKAISLQAHMTVQGWPDFFWNGQQAGLIPQITLDLDHVAFWKAIEAVCQATHTHPQFIGQPNDITLAMGNAGKWDQEGRFAFVPTVITRASDVDLTTGSTHKADMLMFSAYIDPKLHATHCDNPRVTLAEDDRGNSLLPAGPINADEDLPMNQQPWTLNLNIPLAFPAHYGSTIARLEGTIRVELADRTEKLQIKDLVASVGTQSSAAGRLVDVVACTFNDKQTVSLHLQINRAQGDAKTKAQAEADLSESIQLARVVDADGQQMRPSGTWSASDTDADWTGTFAASTSAKPPFMLRWMITTHQEPMVVGFKFKDVALPPH